MMVAHDLCANSRETYRMFAPHVVCAILLKRIASHVGPDRTLCAQCLSPTSFDTRDKVRARRFIGARWWTIQARCPGTAVANVRTLLPEVPVEVRALLPQRVRSPQPVADFIAAFRTVTGGA
jgi:hypothetical protein